ncbi:hypothetical protein ASG06_07700 [Rathayibacter sp. Leaf185]|nr:hypothetical protein ASF42_07700 [Rathayibacter sp. Leaf294]KQS11856.1 hypothetical protein ASG06_07700 [Rathayibacter sp. Leaf185]
MSVPLGLASIAVGWAFNGLDPLDVQCARGPFPDAGGPFFEPTRVTGEPTLLPVGVSCTYDVDGDDVGAQTIRHDNLSATVGLIVSTLAFGGGGVLVLVRD